MIKAYIIDDEPDSIETLQWKLNTYCPEVEIVKTFENAVEGMDHLKKDPPELLFLDIEMPMLSGFDILEELKPNISFAVIFTTAYNNFGIQAVKASALDYLLKPIQNKELKKAVEKFKKKSRPAAKQQMDGLLSNIKAAKQGEKSKIALSTKESIEFVSPDEIVVCQSSSNYTIVFLTNGKKKVISKTLGDFEDLLQPYNFYRSHNSHLVNLDQVRTFMRQDGGYLIMQNQMQIPVSKSRRESLLKLL